MPDDTTPGRPPAGQEPQPDSAVISQNRGKGKSSKRKGRKLPVWLLETEAAALVSAAREEEEAAKTPGRRRAAERNRLMMLVGLYMGLRVSEIVGLRVEHVDTAGGQALVYQGKGGKDRYVPVREDLAGELRRWMGDRREGWVFPSPRGGRLTERAVRFVVAKLAGRARILKKLSPHKLRHTFASRLVQRGVDIVTVRDLLGHSSIAVTQVYLHADATRFKNAVDRL